MKRATRLRNCTLAVVGVVILIVLAAIARATPPEGITLVTLANALYGDIDIGAQRPDWKAELRVTGLSDVVVNGITAAPGGHSGWHSHPGLSLYSVTHGTAWLYDGDDPTCTPTIVTAGHGFAASGDQVHMIRNEDEVEARWTTTLIHPAGSAGRIDQPDPGHCPF